MSLKFEPVSDPELQRALDIISIGVVDWRGLLFIGTGAPGGVVVASPPAIYLNRSGGAATTLYVKESGVGTSAGWVGK